MRNWCFLPSPQELAAVSAAAKAFRDKWESIRPPFPAAFDGTITDVRAIDYMDYEGIDLPRGGLEASAMVCGEVLRRAAGLEWVISYRGDWLVVSREEIWPAIAVCPLSRLHEQECGAAPPVGKHLWFLQKAAFECLLLCGPEREPMVRGLLDGGGDYLESVETTLEMLRRTRRSTQQHPPKRSRRSARKNAMDDL
jgi:hypothetical protein